VAPSDTVDRQLFDQGLLQKATVAVFDRLLPRTSPLGLLDGLPSGSKRPSPFQMIQQQADDLREFPFRDIRKWCRERNTMLLGPAIKQFL
jgi:hypothetical protein